MGIITSKPIQEHISRHPQRPDGAASETLSSAAKYGHHKVSPLRRDLNFLYALDYQSQPPHSQPNQPSKANKSLNRMYGLNESEGLHSRNIRNASKTFKPQHKEENTDNGELFSQKSRKTDYSSDDSNEDGWGKPNLDRSKPNFKPSKISNSASSEGGRMTKYSHNSRYGID